MNLNFKNKISCSHILKQMIFCLILISTVSPANSDQQNSLLGLNDGSGSRTPTAKGTLSKAKCLENFNQYYLSLQAALDYDGKNANPKYDGIVKRTEEKTNVANGKIFEMALAKEFQRTLRKLARNILKENSKKSSLEAVLKDNNDTANNNLINFFMKIDEMKGSGQSELNKGINGKNTKKQFETNLDKLGLNKQEIYLITNLVSHANDKYCSDNSTGKRNKAKAQAGFTRQQQIFNQLLTQLKKASDGSNKLLKPDGTFDDAVFNKIFGENNDPKLSEAETAVSNTVKQKLDALKNWVAQNTKCRQYINAGRLITLKGQKGFSSNKCNFDKFVSSLPWNNKENEKLNLDIQNILHFINANEKEKNTDTGLDYFEQGPFGKALDSAFTVSTSIPDKTCKNNQNKIELRNFGQYENQGSFENFYKITCKSNNAYTSGTACAIYQPKVSTETETDLTGHLAPVEGITEIRIIKNEAEGVVICDPIDPTQASTPTSTPEVVTTSLTCPVSGSNILTINQPDVKIDSNADNKFVLFCQKDDSEPTQCPQGLLTIGSVSTSGQTSIELVDRAKKGDYKQVTLMKRKEDKTFEKVLDAGSSLKCDIETPAERSMAPPVSDSKKENPTQQIPLPQLPQPQQPGGIPLIELERQQMQQRLQQQGGQSAPPQVIQTGGAVY